MKKIYSFFLPQFHESEHNNRWWGKGFTEWDLVKSTTPLYPEHKQPRVPLNGYFNLLEKGELQRQSNLAKEHGIDGFIIYHYWYRGERLLHKPIDLILSNPTLDISFSLCWANHSWTRSWKNRIGALDTLIEQTYETTFEERVKHFDYLISVFKDRRCIRVKGKPIFHIYKPEVIPKLKEMLIQLREYVFEQIKEEIHISAIITDWNRDWSYLNLFDSVTLSQPALSLYAPVNVFSDKPNSDGELLNTTTLIRSLPMSVKKILYKVQDKFYNKVKFFDYDRVWTKLIEQSLQTRSSGGFEVYPSAFIDFDNTARYKNRARIMKGYSPEKFKHYLSKFLQEIDSEIVFIYAWNEWSESMYLQPDIKQGTKVLESIKELTNKTIHSLNNEIL